MIDLHCDTLLKCMGDKDHHLRQNAGHIDLEKMRRGGLWAQCFAVYVPTHGEDMGLAPMDYHRAAVALFRKELAENADRIVQARTAGELVQNMDAGKLSAILTVEDAVALEGKIERLDEFWADGVRMASFTWNYENSLAYPNSFDPDEMNKGLKEFGFECLERMNELGMVADVSHLSEGGFWDVAKHSKKPFAASHSDARALCDHSRSLTDEQLRAIGETGSVVGVNYCAEFLREGSDYSTIRDIVRHMDYMRQKAGIDAVALGSDYDGIGCELELKDCSHLPRLVDALSERFTDGEIEKICRGNVLRLFRDVIGG